ncbi:MAG: hypothetical protein OIN66_04420 [Candidatus Methanoperedens sp.]|nr:hypothetical protein [Candidatus Methanoperedens sp.]
MIIIKETKNDAGQISLDYIAGITIFILSFIFLYNILTSLLLPFQFNSDEVKPLADRTAMILVESTDGLTASTNGPNIIDKTKIIQLNTDLNNPSTYDNKRAELGLVNGNLKYNLNVSLRYFNYSLYPNSSNPLMLGGSIPAENTNVGQTIRMVYLSQDSKRLMLLVKVWI